MKMNITALLTALTIIAPITTVSAEDETMIRKTASYIPMTAAPGKTQHLAQFLTDAAPLVKATEPGTELWFALQGPVEGKLAIFDTFQDEAARDAHFSGEVAGALKAHSAELVNGGWDDGVVANINGAKVLSEKAPVNLYDAVTATYIKIQAAPGQGEALAGLLTAAGSIVADTEPKTLYWVALRLDEDNFAIFDVFADESGREAHFAGKVASMLKDKSSELVKGGWDEGIVANVSHFKILAIK
ncbi:MAG: hypothetical protein AAFX56_11170 [Pseudomonadota bacterium]